MEFGVGVHTEIGKSFISLVPAYHRYCTEEPEWLVEDSRKGSGPDSKQG